MFFVCHRTHSLSVRHSHWIKALRKSVIFIFRIWAKRVGRNDEFVWKRKPNGIAFYWISFCINFHRSFSFLALLLLLSSSFCKLDLFVCAFLWSIRSTILPLVSSASSPIFEIIRNNIWKSTSKRWFHKLFTSYTTNIVIVISIRHLGSGIDGDCVSVCGVGPRMIAKIHKLCSILKLNLYTKLHIYWILPTTHTLSLTHKHSNVIYGTISQALVNIQFISFYLIRSRGIFNGAA